MYIDTFTGNQNIKLSLEEQIKTSKLSHAVLIFGKKGCGVNCFAGLLAADIIGVPQQDFHLIEENAHSQVQTIAGSGASGQIKVDSVRAINENVNFSSLGGEKRVVIIRNCENFNQSSANALLKNLEEPKDDITYILTCTDPSAILPTIRSRCQVYSLTQPTVQQCREYFALSKSEQKDKIISIYGGNIGMVKAALDNPKRMEILQRALEAQSLINGAQWYRLAVLLYAFNKKKEDFLLFLQDLEYICDSSLQAGDIAVLGAAAEAKTAAERNGNLALIMEKFIIDVKNG